MTFKYFNIKDLPDIQGQYYFDFNLGEISYIKVGGRCDVLYIPENINDLIYFIQHKPSNLPITILGNLSNTLVLDKGIRGCVVSLRKLNNIEIYDNYVKVECGINLSNLIIVLSNKCISCCEQLYTIPGTIGGALAMNAGIPGFEIKDVLKSIDLVNSTTGELITITGIDMQYRNGNLPKVYIATSCILKTTKKEQDELMQTLRNTLNKRLRTQPIHSATLGSTFKNPAGFKAWELIKESGCHTLKVGGASLSNIHCNFIVNNGTATTNDIIHLINLVQKTVFQRTEILLELEIRIIGKLE